jgi:hypothetical protein
MQLGRPDLARPAPPTQYGGIWQTIANLRPHPVQATRRAARTITFTSAIERGGNAQAQLQLSVGKAIQALISEGNMQKIESNHGRLA